MRLIFALCASLSLACGTVLIGGERCTWGPGYWCSAASSAKECNAVEHCVQNVWRKEPSVGNLMKAYKAQVNEGGEMCQLCELGIQELIDHYKANATADIHDLVDKYVCARFGPLKDLCDDVFDKEIDQLVKAIEQGSGADAICKEFGLCTTQSQPMIELTPAKQVKQKPLGLKPCTWGPSYWCSEAKTARECNAVDHCVSSWKKSPTSANLRKVHEAVTANDLCTECEAAVQKVIDFANQNSTDQEIEDYIDNNVCAVLGPFADSCKQLVAQELPEILKQLRENVKPKQLCATFGLCSSKLTASPKKVKSGGECTMCSLVMKEVENFISSNSTESEIEAALDKVCGLLPSTISDECHDFVDNYLPGIINLITLEVPPKAICAFLGLCSTPSESPKRSALKSSTGCQLCEMAVQYITLQLKQNKTDVEILNTLKKLCQYIPNSKAECISVIDEYGQTIIQLLLSELNPQTVCTELTLCQSKKQVLGSKPCEWGPSYWCKTRETAAECNAVAHCENHWWN